MGRDLPGMVLREKLTMMLIWSDIWGMWGSKSLVTLGIEHLGNSKYKVPEAGEFLVSQKISNKRIGHEMRSIEGPVGCCKYFKRPWLIWEAIWLDSIHLLPRFTGPFSTLPCGFATEGGPAWQDLLPCVAGWCLAKEVLLGGEKERNEIILFFPSCRVVWAGVSLDFRLYLSGAFSTEPLSSSSLFPITPSGLREDQVPLSSQLQMLYSACGFPTPAISL